MDPKRLREETRAEHEATEAGMPLTGRDLSRRLYGRVLLALLPVVAGWETWAAANAPQTVQPMLARRQRSGLVRADLRALHVCESEAETPQLDWDAVVTADVGLGAGGREDAEFRAAFLGAMYVMEGSTLGGRFIARHVEEVLGLRAGEGDAYFRGHGEATGAMWREVTREIESVPEPLAPVVIAAAKRTFRAFGDAMTAGLAAPPVVHE